ncbi:hypothetical protein HPB47_018893 [Ixodes persulcatus]|uniref:Uncharacterized protein n=1 Tax=Ixodes persulcatus TaxID=34615 RepID=A0AC60QJK1_IXOPE|nr:hypothetical protein HPB47_018893 [Ixodes persulcatus]
MPLISAASTRASTDYDGKSNAALDVPNTEAEVREVLLRLKTKSGPGSEGVTNEMLRNLGDGAGTYLTRYIDACEERGSIPQQWKTTKVVIIPKPGKKPQLDSLRPTSLTSCSGKVMKDVVLGRLNRRKEQGDDPGPGRDGLTGRPRLIVRISDMNYGMNEGSLMRLVQAFVMSRLVYVVSFMRLGAAEKSKLKSIVRKAHKRALGLTESTSNEKLAARGVHNTIDELIEPQRMAKLERLTRRTTSRHILKSLQPPVRDAKRRERGRSPRRQGDAADFPHPKARASRARRQEKGGEGQGPGKNA